MWPSRYWDHGAGNYCSGHGNSSGENRCTGQCCERNVGHLTSSPGRECFGGMALEVSVPGNVTFTLHSPGKLHINAPVPCCTQSGASAAPCHCGLDVFDQPTQPYNYSYQRAPTPGRTPAHESSIPYQQPRRDQVPSCSQSPAFHYADTIPPRGVFPSAVERAPNQRTNLPYSSKLNSFRSDDFHVSGIGHESGYDSRGSRDTRGISSVYSGLTPRSNGGDSQRFAEWDGVPPPTPGSSIGAPLSPEIICLPSPTEVMEVSSTYREPELRRPSSPDIATLPQNTNQRPSGSRQRLAYDIAPRTPTMEVPPPTPGGFDASCPDVFEITPIPSPETIDLSVASPMEEQSTVDRPTSPNAKTTSEVVVDVCSPPNFDRLENLQLDTSSPPSSPDNFSPTAKTPHIPMGPYSPCEDLPFKPRGLFCSTPFHTRSPVCRANKQARATSRQSNKATRSKLGGRKKRRVSSSSSSIEYVSDENDISDEIDLSDEIDSDEPRLEINEGRVQRFRKRRRKGGSGKVQDNEISSELQEISMGIHSGETSERKSNDISNEAPGTTIEIVDTCDSSQSVTVPESTVDTTESLPQETITIDSNEGVGSECTHEVVNNQTGEETPGYDSEDNSKSPSETGTPLPSQGSPENENADLGSGEEKNEEEEEMTREEVAEEQSRSRKRPMKDKVSSTVEEPEGSVKPAGRWEKRVRGLGASFILDEAEEGDEEGDEDWIDDEASEASEAAAAAAEALRRREADDAGWRPLRSSSPTVSDIINRLRLENVDPDTGSPAPARVPRPGPLVDQQALLPAVTDPSLWMVKCRPGHERVVAFTIMKKCFSRARVGTPDEIRIHTVVFNDNAPKFLYIEALRKQHAQVAVTGMQALPRAVDQMKQVPIPEMPDVLKAGRCEPRIGEGQWVRPMRGLYRGDVARVEEVDQTEKFATVRILPRVDYPRLGGQRGGVTVYGRRGGRPAPRRLDVEALRAAGVDVSAAPSGMLIFRGATYKDGFLLKRFPVKSLVPTQPKLSEVEAFGVDHERSLSLAKDPEMWLGLDDPVECFEGALKGMRGVVQELRGDTAMVKLYDRRIVEPIPCATSELRKTFSDGDRVRVMEGNYRDATGLVVRTDADRVVFTEDDTNREIEVLVRHVRLAQNSAPAAAPGGLRCGSMVKMADGSVAVVMRVEGATVRVLDPGDREKVVPLRSVRPYSPPRMRRAFPALDCEQNEVRIRDKVVAVDGSHRGKSGTVLAVLRGRLFVQTNDGGDRCLFAAPGTHVRLQGGASDRQSMLLRQLDCVASVVGSTPQPGSPAPGSTPFQPPSGLPGVDVRRRPRGPHAFTPRADFSGLQRDTSLTGCTVSIISGAFKSCIGTVKSASRLAAQIDLHSPRQTISVRCNNLRVIEDPSGTSCSRRQRPVAASGSWHRRGPYPSFYGSQPQAPPRAPASPQPLPSPTFAGIRDSPFITAGFRTPASAITATPMYDVGSRTPLPNPQSPAPLAAVWEPRATPGTCDSISSSPLGYLSMPPEYYPPAAPSTMLTSAPPPPPPPPPPSTSRRLAASWPRPGMEVTVPTSGGARETATVRAVTGDGGVTMVLRSGVLLTLAAADSLLPALPVPGDMCCVVAEEDHSEDAGGLDWGRAAVLVEVHESDAVVRPIRGDPPMEVLPLERLCRVSADYIEP